MADKRYQIETEVQTAYLPDQSDPPHRFTFAYSITIRNVGTVGARLQTRHWIITNAQGQAQEVHGEGVVGEHPYLKPGDSFHYTSGTTLDTPVGTMGGSYGMLAEDGHRFEAPVATFTLCVPHTLH